MFSGAPRDWRQAAPQAQRDLTALLRTPTGSQQLWPLQAMLLHEAWHLGGCFAFVRAGGGKTAALGMLPVLLARLGCRRPLILTTASMIEDTRSVLQAGRAHWQMAVFYELKSYNFLAQLQNRDYLNTYRPDLIICDEAHKLRRLGRRGNPASQDQGAIAPKQIDAYLREHPQTRFVATSGTFHKSRITDFSHLLTWCLRDQSPLPSDPVEIEAWSEAIDDGAAPSRAMTKYGCPSESWSAVKQWWGARLRLTPGVLISDDEFLDSELRVHVTHVEPGLAAEFEAVRARGERPDGYALTPGRDSEEDAKPDLSLAGTTWAVARQLALGFYYTFDPQPPREWLSARKRWARYVRAAIQAGWAQSELEVRNACAAATNRVPEYEDWFNVKDTFRHQRATRWLSDHAIRYAQEWGARGPGIVWYEHQAVGEALARATGWRHYVGGGREATTGEHCRNAPGSAPIICSRPANYEGRNLQQFHRALGLGIPNANLIFEQQLARQHRHGQRSPWCEFEVYAACVEYQSALENVLLQARHSLETTTLPQRILRARITTSGELPQDSWAWRTAKPRQQTEGTLTL